MNIIKQFCIILVFSFIGEILNYLIPLPVPGSIYGLVFLFLTLEFKILKVQQIKEVSKYLLGIMSIFFVPSSVGFMQAFPIMKKYGFQFTIIAIISTIIVFIVTGQITQLLIKITKKNNGKQK